MNNPHIIVGEGRRCICGSYDVSHTPIGCADIIKTLDSAESWACANINPSLHIKKGEQHPPQPPSPEELLRLVAVLRPLIQDCT